VYGPFFFRLAAKRLRRLQIRGRRTRIAAAAC